MVARRWPCRAHSPRLARRREGELARECRAARCRADRIRARFGAALTHPYITTDYSEALPELVTPPQRTQWETLQFLCDVHAFIERRLDGELLWPASMPCDLPPDDEIPIADYGPSNRRPHEDRLPPRSRPSLRPRDAGDRRRAFQLLVAGRSSGPSIRRIAAHSGSLHGVPLGRAHGARAQLSSLRVARDVSCSARRRRCAVRSGRTATSCSTELDRATWYAPYATSLRMSDLRLPKQDARALEHPRELAGRVRGRHAQRRDDGGAALRGDRRRRRRRLSAAQREHPADRERVLQHDSPEAEQGEQASAARRARARPASTTSRCARST